MISQIVMKPLGTFLIVFLLYPSCEGLFLVPLTRRIHSVFGSNATPAPMSSKYVIGTASELRQVRSRFPGIDPSHLIDINSPEAKRFPQPHGLDAGYGQQPMKHLGAYAQPPQEPEAPAYGKATSSYGNPKPSYGKPAPSYSKPVSSYPKPEVNSGYGKPEQPIDQGEPQPVPEAADLPSVNNDSDSNWSSQTSSNEVNISQTASSSSSASSITQTASISDNAGSSDSVDAGAEKTESSSDGGEGSNSVLQEVSVHQTGSNESNADFFPPQLPPAQASPPLTSDNVIRPASRPPSTPNQQPASENAADAGNSGENISSPPIGDSSNSVTQEASVQQTVSDAADSGSISAPTSPDFVSDNVIRPASRPVSSPESVSTPENNEVGSVDNTVPATTGANAEVTQSASSDSGSVVQDASIEQNVDSGASTPATAESSETSAAENDSSNSKDQQEAADASAVENDSSSSGSDGDVFVVNHSKSENSFNETKTSHNTTKETTTTIVTTHLAGVDPSAPGQISAAKQRHPFLNQAHKLISNKLPKTGSGRLMRRSADENEGEMADAPQNPQDVEEVPAEEVHAEDETELDLRHLADSYPVLEKQEDIEDYFTYISNIDTDHCLAKTICELASNPSKKGTEGVQIDEFFDKYDASNSKEGMKMYKDAHVAGKGGEETCLKRFPDCKIED